MTDEIYQRAIKELAHAGHGAGRLDAPSASARLDNPLCGDRIVLDVLVAGGRIVALGYETRGCLLCRAAASLVGRTAPGAMPILMADMHAELLAMLEGRIDVPVQWTDVAAFSPIRAHRNRHGCVLLPFRALNKALSAFRDRFSVD